MRTGTKQQLKQGAATALLQYFPPFSSLFRTYVVLPYYSAEIKGGGGDGEERFCLLLLLSVRTVPPSLPFGRGSAPCFFPQPSPPLFRRESPSDSKLSLMALLLLGKLAISIPEWDSAQDFGWRPKKGRGRGGRKEATIEEERRRREGVAF